MFNIDNDQGNANQNHNEIPLHTPYDGCDNNNEKDNNNFW